MKPTLVFDYDGTIHNTMRIYEPAIRETYSWLLANGYTQDAAPEAWRIKSWLGMNAREMWLDFMPELEEAVRDKASDMVGAYMANQVIAHEARWYEGAVDTLDYLKSAGYRMVILSNSKKKSGQVHFQEFSMDRWFECWYDCESFDWAPKTDIIKEVAKKYPGELIVIGDRQSDYEAAAAVGARFIGCAYGYGSSRELEGADYLIDTIEELQTILGR